MTPAPETGRTAEEMRDEIIAALNAAFRGFSFPGGRWSTGYGAKMAADALIAGPLAPVLAEIAQLRSRLLQAEKGGEAMREAAAQIALTDCRSDFAKQWDVYPEWDSYAIDIARAIRALPLAAKAAPLPATRSENTGGRS